MGKKSDKNACSIKGCGKKAICKSYCRTHYVKNYWERRKANGGRYISRPQKV